MIVWLVLAVAIYFFNTARNDFEDLANHHIPGLTLASELTRESANLSQLTSTIVSAKDSLTSANIREDLTATFDEISRLLKEPDLVSSSTISGRPDLIDEVSSLLESILKTNENLSDLDAALSKRRADLRWPNVDIQDEVDTLLRDFSFNIKVAMASLTKSQDPDFREKLAVLIKQERNLRDATQQIGSETATLVTLMLQGSIAVEGSQLDQLFELSDDAIFHLNSVLPSLPEQVEHLTLKQSVNALSDMKQDKAGIFALRSQWIAQRLTLLTHLNDVQMKLTELQTMLAGISKTQREQVQTLVIESARQTRTAIMWLLILTLLTALIAGLTLFGYIRLGIVQPLGKMSAAMQAISDGKPAPKLQVWGHDEIARMAKAVEAFQESVLARDRTLDELQQTQSELIQAGKLAALGQLSSGISHELNQPLGAMKHRIHLLEKGLVQQDKLKINHQVDKLNGLVERMESTIVHLKRYARRSEYRSDPLRIDGIVRDSLALLTGRLTDEAVDVVLDRSIEGIIIIGDSILIEQVVINLISNSLDAIKASGEHGKILFSGQILDKMFQLSVSDTGIGLQDISTESAFDPFVTTKDVGEGLGLGLSISHSIARDMGGDLKLVPAKSRGMIAILTLPLGEHND